jgi:hypothetical protein
MQWRPEPDQASAWSAVSGVVVVVSATSAVLLAVQPSTAHVPNGVIYACIGLAMIGFYGMLAPLLKWWPWHGAVAAFGGRALPRRIRGERVDLAVLDPSRAIMQRTFKGCEIFGSVNVLFGECHIEHTMWARPELLVVPDQITLPPGTITFYGCRFSKCKFSGITAVGTEREIKALLAIFPPGRAG